MSNPGHRSAHVWLVMTKALHSIGNCLSAHLQSLGLTDTDFRILEAVLHKGPLPVNVIGPKVHLNTGSISVAVDRLHVRGLVSRTEHEEDRRVRTVSLTPKGLKLIKQAYRKHAELISTLFSPLDPTEQNQLEAMLKKIGIEASRRFEGVNRTKDCSSGVNATSSFQELKSP